MFSLSVDRHHWIILEIGFVVIKYQGTFLKCQLYIWPPNTYYALLIDVWYAYNCKEELKFHKDILILDTYTHFW